MPLPATENGASPRTRGKGRPRTSDTAAPSLVEILNLIRSERATTRQALERESELGRAVVADRLQLLSDLGLVDESELGLATGGRAPRLVRFAARRGVVLVATLDQTAIGVGVSDLSGNLLTEHHEAADLTGPGGAACKQAHGAVPVVPGASGHTDRLLGHFAVGARHGVLGPGGRLHDGNASVLPAWEDFPLVETLTHQFGVPVWMRSSVETMTMGELHAGAGQGLRSMLFIKVGRRIGAGIVCDGQLYRGAQGAAGLIGALPVNLGRGNRHTGHDGRVRHDAARRSRGGRKRPQSGSGRSICGAEAEITPIEVSQAAQIGDPAVSWRSCQQSGHLIGQVVATLANSSEPRDDRAVGYAWSQTNDILLAGIREAVYGASHPLVTRDLRIIRSQMGSSAGLVGAARVASEALFAPAFLKDWILLGRPTLHPDFASFPRAAPTKQKKLAIGCSHRHQSIGEESRRDDFRTGTPWRARRTARAG